VVGDPAGEMKFGGEAMGKGSKADALDNAADRDETAFEGQEVTCGLVTK